MSKSEPYYCKFGFKSGSTPIKVRNNKEHWKLNPIITKQDIYIIINNNIKLIDNKKLDKIISKSLEIFSNDFSVSDYMNYLYKLAEEEEKQLDIKRQQYIKQAKAFNKINTHTWLIVILLKDIYVKAGYELLPTDIFIMFLQRE